MEKKINFEEFKLQLNKELDKVTALVKSKKYCFVAL